MRTFALSLAVVAVLAVAAQADVITHTATFSDDYAGTFNIDEVLSVPQFDPSLGQLVSVTMSYGIDADGTLGYENTNPNSGGTKVVRTFFQIGDEVYSTYGSLALSMGGSTLAQVNWDVRQTYTFTVGTYDGTTDYAGTSGWSTVYLDLSDADSMFLNSDMGAFVGTGTVDLDLVGEAWAAVSFPSGSTQFRTLGAGAVTVAYEYIPEPATLGLLIVGALAILRRRFR